MFLDDFTYMQQAIALAEEAGKAGDVPVGAVIVDRNTGEVIGRGRNRVEQDCSPTAHAEMLAIAEAARLRGTRLTGCTLYVTLEPCPMCSGAIMLSRLTRLVFGAYDPRQGGVCSVAKLLSLPESHRPRVTAGLLEEPCSHLLQDFFRSIRDEGKNKAQETDTESPR